MTKSGNVLNKPYLLSAGLGRLRVVEKSDVASDTELASLLLYARNIQNYGILYEDGRTNFKVKGTAFLRRHIRRQPGEERDPANSSSLRAVCVFLVLPCSPFKCTATSDSHPEKQ